MQELDDLILYIITISPDGVIQRKDRLTYIINNLSEILDLNVDTQEIDKSIMNLKQKDKIKIQHIESITGDYKYTKYISTSHTEEVDIPNKNKIQTVVQKTCEDTRRIV